MSDDGQLAWADATLAAAGRSRTGPATVEADQPWGRVLRLPTATGPVWLKAPARGTRFELAVLDLLAPLDPPLTPRVLASDRDLGVVLLEDAGRPLADVHAADAVPTAFVAALVEVGRLQRAAVPLVDDLLAAGVPDLRPTVAAARFDEVVAVTPDLPATVAAARPALVDDVRRLAASGVPVSIDHNDLHDGNLLQDTSGRVTVVDWGDAVVTHPFAVLLVAGRVLASLLGDVAPDHPVIARARRDYLAVFADLAPGEDLEATAARAVRVAHLGRAWAWHRATSEIVTAGADPGPFATAARDWLELGATALTDDAAREAEPGGRGQ